MFKTIKKIGCISSLLLISTLAQANVCIYLDKNFVGKQGDVTVFKVTAKTLEAAQGQVLISKPVKYGDSYYFNFKQVPGMTALTVESLTITRDGSPHYLTLTCTNPYIRPVAHAAYISVSQDTWDEGQCLLSTTPVESISPCHN